MELNPNHWTNEAILTYPEGIYPKIPIPGRWTPTIFHPFPHFRQASAVQSLLGALGELVDACDELGATALEKAWKLGAASPPEPGGKLPEEWEKLMEKAPVNMGSHGP